MDRFTRALSRQRLKGRAGPLRGLNRKAAGRARIPPSNTIGRIDLRRYGKITATCLENAPHRVDNGGMRPDAASIRTALILQADKLYADMLRQYVLRISPKAQVSAVATVAEAQRYLDEKRAELFIADIESSREGDILDILIPRSARLPLSCRVLVVTGSREFRMLSALRALSVEGVFDTNSEQPEQLHEALRTVALGMRYWSTSVLDFIRQGGAGPQIVSRFLTEFEQIVLSVIGDGSDDLTASRVLRLSPATVCTVRRELHRKLGVQHRGALVRVAAQYGFVRFTPFGVERPGFKLLTATYRPRKRKTALDDEKKKDPTPS